MGALIGFVMGYVLGAREGPEALERAQRAWQEIAASEEFQALVATGMAFAQSALHQGGNQMVEQLKVFAEDNDLLRKLGTGNQQDLLAAFSTLSESKEFQDLLANGMNIFNGIVEQGMAQVRTPFSQAH